MSDMILEIFDIDLSMREPLITSQQTISQRSGQEIHLAHEGCIGKGEVLPLPLWSKVTDLETKEELKGIQSNMEGFLINAQSFSHEVQAGMTPLFGGRKLPCLANPYGLFLAGLRIRCL